MENFNVKQHHRTNDTWDLVSAISPAHAAKVYAAMLATKFFTHRVSSYKVDVQSEKPDAQLLTFNVEIELYAEAKLISKLGDRVINQSMG